MRSIIWAFGFVLWGAVSFLFAQQSDQIAGKVTFVKGNVQKVGSPQSVQVQLGQIIAVNDLIAVNEGGKIRLLLKESKALVTVMPVSRVKITPEGVELVEGSKENLFEQKAGFLNPDPNLDARSRQLGGTYVTRSAPAELELLNLNGTFSRNTKPMFSWKTQDSSEVEFRLYLQKSGGIKKILLSRKISGSTLVYPAEEPELEKGQSYCWELYRNNSQVSQTACFYVLSESEESNFFRELAEIERLTAQDTADLSTKNVLTVELLKKYNLLDDMKKYVDG